MLINKNFTKKQYPERRRHVFPDIFAAKVTYFFFIQKPNPPPYLPVATLFYLEPHVQPP